MRLELSGIDGRNPLGFVGALGVVAAAGGKLFWEEHTTRWTPVLTELAPDRRTREHLVDLLWARLEPMPFAYTLAEEGEAPYDDFKEKKDSGTNGGRTPTKVRSVSENVFRGAIERCWDQPEELQRLAAHTCVVALRGERVGVTAVRSVSGQMRYLKNLRDIVTAAKREDIDRALFGNWDYRRGNPKLGLDPNGFLENIPVDISSLGSVAEIGAERLALEGLRGLPTTMRYGRLTTRGYDRYGRQFRWALSSVPRSFVTSAELLDAEELFEDCSVEAWMRTTGVGIVLRSDVLSYSHGYKVLRPGVVVASASSSSPVGTNALTLSRSN